MGRRRVPTWVAGLFGTVVLMLMPMAASAVAAGGQSAPRARSLARVALLGLPAAQVLAAARRAHSHGH